MEWRYDIKPERAAVLYLLKKLTSFAHLNEFVHSTLNKCDLLKKLRVSNL